MADKPIEKKRITIGKVIPIILTAIIIFILFPRRESIKDGGSVYYDSGLGGFVYSVKQLHEYVSEKDNDYIRKGIRIYVFGKAVYEDSYIDYDHPLTTGHSPEYYEKRRQIESALGINEIESQVPSTSVSSEETK